MVNWNPLGTIWHPFEGAGRLPFDIFCVYVFCSANGVVTCVYYSKGDDERKFFKPATVCGSSTGRNEELCRRLGMGLALDAASVHNGMKVLSCPKRWTSTLHKTGIPKILAALAADKGTAFVDALAILNVGQTGVTSGEGSQEGPQSLRGILERMIGGLGPGGLDSWDPLIKGIVTWGHPQNPKPSIQNVSIFVKFTL